MDLRDKLLDELQRVFGERNPNTARFGSTSLGELADQLSLSKSLITKLMSGTATQGMYERCLNNLNRIKEAKELSAENLHLKNQLASPPKNKIPKSILFLLLSFSIGSLIVFYKWSSLDQNDVNTLEESSNFLDAFFNPDFNSPSLLPYLPIDKVQDYCPCSGYEGDWELAKQYTIPIPFKKPGLYYVAKSSDIKLKCVSSETGALRGKKMHGFEFLKHELWMDSKHEALVPKYFNADKKHYTKEFYNLDFDSLERFDKVAEITSFFYNTFEISKDKIIRKGEHAGRYANYVNQSAVDKYKIDLNEILNHAIGDMTKVTCDEIPNPNCNPNRLKSGESIMEFPCDFTIGTENLGYGGTYPYVKSLLLVNQHYSNNLLCGCD